MQKYLYRVASLLDIGLNVAFSSDAPVIPINPLEGLYAAITRLTDAGNPVNREEAIDGLERLNVVRSKIPAVTHVDYSARLQTGTGPHRKIALRPVIAGSPDIDFWC